MKDLTDKLFKQEHSSYVISLSSGVIEGGCEQVAMNIVPKTLKRDDVIIWNFNRGINATPIIHVYLRVKDTEVIDDIVDEYEEAIATELDDDYSLRLQRLVELTEVNDRSSEHPLGVRSDVLDNINDQEYFDQWQMIDHIISQMIIHLFKQVKHAGLDRKTQAPHLLYAFLKNFIEPEQISIRSNQFVQMLLTDHPKKQMLEKKIKQTVFQLNKDGLNFLDKAEDEISNDEIMIGQITEITNLMKLASENNGLEDIDLNVWKSSVNKLGFSDVEAAYISAMVSVSSKEKL